MTSPTNDDGDLSKHFVINSITMQFNKDTKPSNKLEMIFNEIPITLNNPENVNTKTRRWTSGNELEIPMFLNSGDRLTLRIAPGKRRGCLNTRKDGPEEMQLVYGDITDEFQKQKQAISLPGRNCTIVVEVTTGDIRDILPTISDEELNPLLDVQDIIASSDSFLQNTRKLQSILQNIPVTEDAWRAMERGIDTVAQTHPLAKAVLTALSIPYKLLKNEHKFKQNMKDLADTMLFTCKCLVDIRFHTKMMSAKEQFASIMKILRDAALFVGTYGGKSKIGQFIGAQFPARLEKYAEALITQKNNFQVAMILQIAVDVDNIAWKTSDDFLRDRLEPVKQQELGDGCLEETRVNILKQVRDWLQDGKPENKILWIAGDPGAGKSTVATTIAKEFADKAPFCASFFCDRDVPDLRDPRQIWRSLAYNLATKHDGVKAALMATLDPKTRYNPKGHSVIDQFEKLIKGPLETDMGETHFLSRRIAYPVILIDGLDECHPAKGDNWKSLLNSFASWVKLHGVFKLIVTSRRRGDLIEKLGEAGELTCSIIDLATGDGASEDSRSDIRTFFAMKFAEIREDFIYLHLPPNWPGWDDIEEMTVYAAGLFIWADMVVKYIGAEAGGSIPNQRLKDVLGDIKVFDKKIDGRVQVDRLYARILFEAFRKSTSLELWKGKGILGAVVLAKEPLRKSDLSRFLSTDTRYSGDIPELIESTLWVLRPIIPIPDTDCELRVCHKSVSDFLLSRARSADAMEFVVQKWNQEMPNDRVPPDRSFILDCEEENKRLALACVLHLAGRYVSSNFNTTAELLSNRPFYYARQHWFGHLEDAGVNWTPILQDFKNLVDAVELAYGCLERFADNLMLVNDEVEALTKSLRHTADFASQCINREKPIVDPRELKESTMKIHVARGNFQIAMIMSLAPNIDGSADAFLRRRLKPSTQALLDDECLPGTRTSVLRRAEDWVHSDDPEISNILWVIGAPGAGKSAIATTIVKVLESSNKCICAKVFAKRDFEDRRDPTRIWRTLAYDLAGLHVGLKGSVMEALFEKLQQSRTAVEHQLLFRDIAVRAIREQHGLSIVAVIDALDECFTGDSEDWRALLETVAGWANLPGRFKLVVTSRDIPDIRGAMAKVSYSISLTTGDKASIEDSSDIQDFFREKFKLIHADAMLNEELLQQLTKYAAGSFIWAKMAVDLVEKFGPQAIGRLEEILDNDQLGSVEQVYNLYATVLFEVLGKLPEKERNAYRSIIAAIVLAKDPLWIDLAELLPSNVSLEQTHQSVGNVIQELSSIIAVDENRRLRIPHKSFSDFFLDDGRSLEALGCLEPPVEEPRSYLIDREEDNANLAIACLRLMADTLKFNACGIPTSHRSNDNIPQLESLISKNINPALVYACRFWAEHLKGAPCNDQHFLRALQPLLTILLYEKVLYWFEILSLIKEVSSAKVSLQVAVDFLKEYDHNLTKMADDANKFVSFFEEAIATSAPHIYLSALAFCPSRSRMSQIYSPRYPNLLSVTSGRRIDWDNAAMTGGEYSRSAESIAFFPDGSKLASGSLDGTVCIWDVKTGQAISALSTGHTSGVHRVAVSPDGKLIASGLWDGTLRILDSHTGACPLGRIAAHGDVIRSVAFSPDSSRIVTGFDDFTVRVRSVTTGDLRLEPLAGHTDRVTSVAFSPDGTCIASASYDETIRIWDASTGESRRGPLIGHTDRINCIAFSADGHFLVSGSQDGTIRLWDVTRGFMRISTTSTSELEGYSAESISFSPNSNSFVLHCGRGSLYFYTISSGNCEFEKAIYGHNDSIQSVVFAPNGLSVASCSGSTDLNYVGSIKIWMAPTTSTQPPDEATLLDRRGSPVLSDNSVIKKEGWMCDSRRGDDAGVLFWVPEKNREGFWWPRNTTVMHPTVTKIDFSRFAHGDNWTECCLDIV